MRRFFIQTPPTQGAHVTLTGGDARHLTTVLRLAPGDRILLLDGRGGEYEAELLAAQPDDVRLEVLSHREAREESGARITIAQGFLKDRKMDPLVRHYTELGIHRWYPLMAERSIPNPDAKRLAKRAERWEKISRESLKQCRRGMAMEISPPLTFADMLKEAEPYDLKLFFWENASIPLTRDLLPPRDAESPTGGGRRILVALGPEGGFSEREALLAEESGFVACTLGPRILRAETASIASATLVQFLFGDMGPA